MKTCEKCNCIYDDVFEQCPRCNKLPLIGRFEKFIFAAILTLILGIILVFVNFKIALIAFGVFVYFAIIIPKKFPKEWKKASKNSMNMQKTVALQNFSIIHIEGIKNTDQNQKCILKINSEYLSFEDNKENCIKFIKLSDIENLCILEEIEQTVKNKSTIGRAVVGGLLLGGVGAVVGGLSGLNPTMVENKKYYLEIKSSKNPDIIIASDNKTLKNIKNLVLSK